MDVLCQFISTKIKRQKYKLSIEEEEVSKADVDQTAETAETKSKEINITANRQGTESETPIQDNQAGESSIQTGENSTVE